MSALNFLLFFFLMNAVFAHEVGVECHIHEGEPTSACHCHPYEKIACDASGNDLYDEHIVEIKENCAELINGSITECVFDCLQPFEVLHVHFQECGYRNVPQIYKRVEETVCLDEVHRIEKEKDHCEEPIDGWKVFGIIAIIIIGIALIVGITLFFSRKLRTGINSSGESEDYTKTGTRTARTGEAADSKNIQKA